MKRFSVTVNGVAYDVTVEEIGGAAAPVAAPTPVAAPVAAPAPAAAPAAPAVPEKDDSEIVAIVTSVICEELGADPSELSISGIREV